MRSISVTFTDVDGTVRRRWPAAPFRASSVPRKPAPPVMITPGGHAAPANRSTASASDESSPTLHLEHQERLTQPRARRLDPAATRCQAIPNREPKPDRY